MTMILLYLVVLILVAVVLFGVGSVLFGRGERLPPLPRGTTATVLPASGITGTDVDAVKFGQTLRGYDTAEVDWVLDRLGRELDSLRGELSAVYAAASSDSASETAFDSEASGHPERHDADQSDADQSDANHPDGAVSP